MKEKESRGREKKKFDSVKSQKKDMGAANKTIEKKRRWERALPLPLRGGEAGRRSQHFERKEGARELPGI